ncbi:MAG TPA: glycosyltransferase [Chthoniobacterales bacterium]|nr:glycosyltransferase [Chthoniobacterales bacterium]
MVKPRLLVVGPTYAIATNRRKLWALAENFEVTCATSQLNGGTIFGRPAQDFEEQEAPEPIELQRFPAVPSGGQNTRMIYQGLARLFNSNHFDYILVDNEPWGFIKWQAWLLTRLFQPKAMFGEFSWENVERPGLKGFLLSLSYRLSGLVDDYIVCGNQACQQVFLKYGAGRRPTLVAPQLGVDTDLYRPASAAERLALRKGKKIPANCLLVGYCGRFSPEKGILELCDAVSSLRQQHPELHLVLLGDGPCREQLAASNDFWIHLFPPRPHFEVPDFLRSLDIFVLPSKPLRTDARVWHEQFGHVLIEAMACRVATIGSDSGAIPEVLGDSRAIFPHSNTAGLIDLLRKLIEDERFRSALAEQQYRRARKLFSHQAVAQTYTEFLTNVPEEKNSPRRRRGHRGRWTKGSD